MTYAAAAATQKDQAIIIYKLASFYTVDRDNIYPYPFEDIPHMLITCRYSGATLQKNEIVF
jgi:hypothetical protein